MGAACARGAGRRAWSARLPTGAMPPAQRGGRSRIDAMRAVRGR